MDALKEQLREQLLEFVFEPNDALTRLSVKHGVERILRTAKANREIYDFSVVCDETINSPDVIDRNELKVDVAIKPTHKAEFIFIPICIAAVSELTIDASVEAYDRAMSIL